MITDPQQKPPDIFALYVRVKEGHVVRRLGTPHNIGHTYTPATGTVDPRTGARRETAPSAQAWDTETIHAITTTEYDRYRREYEAELEPEGGLVRSEREAWEQQKITRSAEGLELAGGE